MSGQRPSGCHGQSWDGDPSDWYCDPQATEEQIKLLRLQRHLQEDLDKPYLDLSLHDTVSTLILDGHHKRAEQLYREFKIPDKRWGLGWGPRWEWCRVLVARRTSVTHVLRYWWLKISALANRGDWEEMEKFSKSKKSPIGYLVGAGGDAALPRGAAPAGWQGARAEARGRSRPPNPPLSSPALRGDRGEAPQPLRGQEIRAPRHPGAARQGLRPGGVSWGSFLGSCGDLGGPRVG